MAHGGALLTGVAIVAAVLFTQRWLHAMLIEGIQNFLDAISGGGPRTPMHPSPADDSALLRRRSRKAEQ